MDGMKHSTRSQLAAMPQPAPLKMPLQDFGKPTLAERAPAPLRRDAFVTPARLIYFVLPVIITVAFALVQRNRLATGGMAPVEHLHLWLSGFAFLWIAFSMVAACLGLYKAAKRSATPPLLASHRMSVALLIPIHNEDPAAVFGNAAALLEDLASKPGSEGFSLYVLSDTRDDVTAAAEWRAFEYLRQEQGARFNIYYRRRAENTDRKTGNIADWVTNWGAHHEAMLVLDADSLMSADAVLGLRDALAADPANGLVQTWPRILRAEGLFPRVQQFVTLAHGWLLSRGLQAWAGNAANYWGHNAIIRTRAFAAAAGLPHLVSVTGRETLIMSHDFVEAAMLRRAGWQVRFVPEIDGSYEETPGSLMDHIQRDRRWCRGNLQHLRLLAARGLHPVSRFHMLQGAVSYLLAPVWLVLMAIWAVPQMSEMPLGIEGAPPVLPIVEGFGPGGGLLLVAVLAMLLGPKLLSAGAILVTGNYRKFGGFWMFLAAVLAEIVISVIYAPILMVQQVLSVISAIVSARDIWAPQRRGGSSQSWGTLARFHALETIIGVVALVGIVLGTVTIWLAPIALSLMFAVPLSWISSHRTGFLATPDDLSPPDILQKATAARERFASALLEDPGYAALAAE
jgi:membrane glycosyltransferase